MDAVSGQLPTLSVVFALVFALNLVPAFAPPTWMALTLVGFRHQDAPALLLAGTGAVAATSGRIVLAKFSRILLRNKLLGRAHRDNIDVIKARVEGRTTLTAGVFLFYALGPLPSNLLFIAYGLTGLPLMRVAAPFLIGRLISYSLFVSGGAALGRRWRPDGDGFDLYAMAWFIGTQALTVAVVYGLAHLDWRRLIERREIAWLHPLRDPKA